MEEQASQKKKSEVIVDFCTAYTLSIFLLCKFVRIYFVPIPCRAHTHTHTQQRSRNIFYEYFSLFDKLFGWWNFICATQWTLYNFRLIRLECVWSCVRSIENDFWGFYRCHFRAIEVAIFKATDEEKKIVFGVEKNYLLYRNMHMLQIVTLHCLVIYSMACHGKHTTHRAQPPKLKLWIMTAWKMHVTNGCESVSHNMDL